MAEIWKEKKKIWGEREQYFFFFFENSVPLDPRITAKTRASIS